MDASSHKPQPAPTRPGRFWPVLLAFLVIAGFLLWEEHQAHMIGALPYLILLACPLLHMFMHGGHGHAKKDDDAP